MFIRVTIQDPQSLPFSEWDTNYGDNDSINTLAREIVKFLDPSGDKKIDSNRIKAALLQLIDTTEVTSSIPSLSVGGLGYPIRLDLRNNQPIISVASSSRSDDGYAVNANLKPLSDMNIYLKHPIAILNSETETQETTILNGHSLYFDSSFVYVVETTNLSEQKSFTSAFTYRLLYMIPILNLAGVAITQ